MKLCDESVTVFNARVDPALGSEVYAATVLRGVSWRGEAASAVESGGTRVADRVVVRIPEGVDAGGKVYVSPEGYRRAGEVGGLWTLQKGDFVLRGVAADVEEPWSAGAAVVLGVSDNRRGRLGRHWKVVGG